MPSGPNWLRILTGVFAILILAPDLNLQQLKLRLIDDHLNTKKEIAIN